MVPKQILAIVLYGVGLTSITAMVYLAGPMIAFGSYRPLENYIVREIVVVLVIAAFASFAGFKFFRRKKAVKALAEGVTQEDQKESDEIVLKERLKDALATLKASSGNKKDYLYDLPWYLLIGPPGLRQNHGVGEFGTEISAISRCDTRRHRGRRRHTLLRLVVHRRCGFDRHRWALYDPRFRCET
jgi:hypothetical protein